MARYYAPWQPPVPPASLTSGEYTAIRQEWFAELTFRRQRVHILGSWLSGAAVVAAGWLWEAEVCTSVYRMWAVCAVAWLVAWLAVYTLWRQKVVQNNISRVIVRLNRAKSLYGCLLPSQSAGWGSKRLGGWELWVYTTVLCISFSCLALSAFLATSPTDGSLAQAYVAVGILVAGCLTITQQVAYGASTQAEEEAGMTGVRVSDS